MTIKQYIEGTRRTNNLNLKHICSTTWTFYVLFYAMPFSASVIENFEDSIESRVKKYN